MKGVSAGLASLQCSIVRLRIEVYLNHLAPPAWLENTENISHIALPPVRVDSASHHLALYDVEVVRGKCKPARKQLVST